ncbi:MAG: RDD family protein [Paracoccaceae bacterium]
MSIPDPHRDPQFYQGVPLRRFVAFWIDTIAILLLWFVGAVLLAAVTLGLATPLFPVLFVGTAFAYRWLLLSRISATLGMQLTGIEVRDNQGERMTPTVAALHTIGFMVTLTFLPLAILGWILMANSPTRQALHDSIFGTVVINRPD